MSQTLCGTQGVVKNQETAPALGNSRLSQLRQAGLVGALWGQIPPGGIREGFPEEATLEMGKGQGKGDLGGWNAPRRGCPGRLGEQGGLCTGSLPGGPGWEQMETERGFGGPGQEFGVRE